MVVSYLESLAPRPKVWRKNSDPQAQAEHWIYESGRHDLGSEFVKLLKQEK